MLHTKTKSIFNSSSCFLEVNSRSQEEQEQEFKCNNLGLYVIIVYRRGDRTHGIIAQLDFPMRKYLKKAVASLK